MNRAQRRAQRYQRPAIDRNRARADARATLGAVLLCQDFDSEAAAAVCNAIRLAWHRVTIGVGTLEDLELLSDAANIVTLEGARLGEPLASVAYHAAVAIEAMDQRRQRTGRIGPDHAALAAVPDMLDVYCQMVAASTPKAMMQLANRAKQQAISAHARGGAV